MGLEEPVVGPGQAVLPGQAHGPGNAAEGDEPPQPDWRVHLEEPLAAEIGRPAEHEPGHDKVAAAGRVDGGRGVPRALDGDVSARVAPADHEHPPAGERHRLGRALVGGRVQELAGELPRDLGKPGHVVVAAGDHDAGVAAGLAAGMHDPARARRAGRLDPLDREAGADVR